MRLAPSPSTVYGFISIVPPFLIIHGINDQTVPFEQSEELYDKLIENGCDADLIALEGADHADMQFFQDELWDRIIEFFKTKLG